eukprot:gene19862-biopygen19074
MGPSVGGRRSICSGERDRSSFTSQGAPQRNSAVMRTAGVTYSCQPDAQTDSPLATGTHITCARPCKPSMWPPWCPLSANGDIPVHGEMTLEFTRMVHSEGPGPGSWGVRPHGDLRTEVLELEL